MFCFQKLSCLSHSRHWIFFYCSAWKLCVWNKHDNTFARKMMSAFASVYKIRKIIMQCHLLWRKCLFSIYLLLSSRCCPRFSRFQKSRVEKKIKFFGRCSFCPQHFIHVNKGEIKNKIEIHQGSVRKSALKDAFSLCVCPGTQFLGNWAVKGILPFVFAQRKQTKRFKNTNSNSLNSKRQNEKQSHKKCNNI